MPILINESLCAFAPGFIGTGTTAFCFNDNYARFRYVSVHLDGRVETGGDQGRLRNIAAILIFVVSCFHFAWRAFLSAGV